MDPRLLDSSAENFVCMNKLDDEASVCSMRLQQPVSLPDLDDSSMKHVFAYIENYEQDLAWSTLSDSFFIAGGIGYVVLSFFDVFAPQADEERWVVYTIVNVSSPVVYLFNSIIDVKWARSVKERYSFKKAMTDYWHSWRVMLDLEDNQNHNDDDEHHMQQSKDGIPKSPAQQQRPWYDRLRKHAAHRRTILAALTFGIAAMFAVFAMFADYILDSGAAAQAAIYLDVMSVHAYIISALIAISGKRSRPWLSGGPFAILSSPESLEDLGDLFFLIGSVVDSVLCDFTFADDQPAWSVVSSFLWLLDAVLYFRSDLIMSGNLKRRNLEEGGGLMC